MQEETAISGGSIRSTLQLRTKVTRRNPLYSLMTLKKVITMKRYLRKTLRISKYKICSCCGRSFLRLSKTTSTRL